MANADTTRVVARAKATRPQKAVLFRLDTLSPLLFVADCRGVRHRVVTVFRLLFSLVQVEYGSRVLTCKSQSFLPALQLGAADSEGLWKFIPDDVEDFIRRQRQDA
jgi:hypothetical protein